MTVLPVLMGLALLVIWFGAFRADRQETRRAEHLEFDRTTMESNRRLVAYSLAFAGIRTEARNWCFRCGGLHSPGEASDVCGAVVFHRSPDSESIAFHCRTPPTDAEREALYQYGLTVLRSWADKDNPLSFFGEEHARSMKGQATAALEKLGERFDEERGAR